MDKSKKLILSQKVVLSALLIPSKEVQQENSSSADFDPYELVTEHTYGDSYKAITLEDHDNNNHKTLTEIDHHNLSPRNNEENPVPADKIEHRKKRNDVQSFDSLTYYPNLRRCMCYKAVNLRVKHEYSTGYTSLGTNAIASKFCKYISFSYIEAVRGK